MLLDAAAPPAKFMSTSTVPSASVVRAVADEYADPSLESSHPNPEYTDASTVVLAGRPVSRPTAMRLAPLDCMSSVPPTLAKPASAVVAWGKTVP